MDGQFCIIGMMFEQYADTKGSVYVIEKIKENGDSLFIISHANW